ncbi:MAG: aquaporin [Rhodoluna sp.]|jgi:glycerol uptake facilitator-like aquaporin|nr:aquaporin [Rhodoluna sp.]
MNASLKKVIAEFLGTFTYLVAIAGASASESPFRGITAALTLGLMILTLGGISGGHFNPAISIYFFAKKTLSFGTLLSYIAAQLVGAFFGMAAGLSLWEKTIQPFNTGNQVSASIFAGEVVATAGLIFVIGTLINNKQAHLVWIAVTSWFFVASSFTVTSAFANPAVSFGWMFNGISTGSTSTIIIAQLVGLVVAILILMVTGASTAKKTTPAKKAAPAFVPAPIVSAPAAAASKTVAKPAAKKPAAKKPVAKKAPAKATTAKKPAAKKAPAKKAPAKK